MLTEYKTTFAGDITLLGDIAEDRKIKIKKIVDENFKDIMNYNVQGNIIYFSGDFDNSDELVEKFISKILPIIDFTVDNKVETQGDDREDRYDLVLLSHRLCIQEYAFTKKELRVY